MVWRGRGCGRPKGPKNAEDVNDITTMMIRIDVVEASRRRGVTHVIKDDSDDEEES